MKKSIALFLAGCLLMALAACGRTEPTRSESQAGPASSAAGGEPSEAPESAASEEPSAAAQGSLPGFDTTGAIQETVLYEEGGVKITATGLEYAPGQVTLGLTIENNTAQDLSFSSGTLGYSCNAINGFMVDEGYLNCDVTAGKKANETARFSTQELSLYGIDRIASIQMGFTITDPDYNSIYTTPIPVPTTLGEGYEQPQDSFQTAVQNGALQKELGFALPFFQVEGLYEQNGVQVESAGLMENPSGEQMLLLEVVNSGEQPVCFATSDFSFNGIAVHSYAWSSEALLPGTRRVITVDPDSVFDEEFWPAFGFDALTAVEMNVALKDFEGNTLLENTPLQVQVSDASPAVNTEGAEVYNANGVRVLSKQLAVDALDRVCALLLVENTSGQAVDVGVAYDSLSIDGVMNGFTCSDRTVPDGGMAALVVSLNDLEENGISSVDDISSMEMQLEIRAEGSYEPIDSPKVTLSFSAGNPV